MLSFMKLFFKSFNTLFKLVSILMVLWATGSGVFFKTEANNLCADYITVLSWYFLGQFIIQVQVNFLPVVSRAITSKF